MNLNVAKIPFANFNIVANNSFLRNPRAINLKLYVVTTPLQSARETGSYSTCARVQHMSILLPTETIDRKSIRAV